MSVNVVQKSNLKEVSGTGKIKTVSVNGTNVQPDANKNVNISVPTKTSELTNDSNFNDESTNPKANALPGNGGVFRDVAKYASGLKTLASDGKSVSNTAVGSAKKPIYFANGVPVAGTYTLADACAKGVATAVANGNTNLVTSGAVYTALQNAGGASVESGTWTPKLVLSGGHLLTSEAHYWKIGKMVIINASFFDSSLGNAGNGVIQKIQQLPFKTWYRGDYAPIFAAAGQILVVDNQKNVIGNNNTYLISVEQNVTEIDMIKNDSVQLSTSNKTYRMLGYYLTD